jgi:hypothetical protein
VPTSSTDDLVRATSTSPLRCAWVEQLVLAAGTVRRAGEGVVQVVGHAPSGALATVDLPDWLLLSHHVTPGQPVWVLSRSLGEAALVEVEPSLYVSSIDELANRAPWTLSSVTPEGAGSVDELDDEERAAEHYARTGAALPGPGHWAALVADARAGRLPRRHLRPVG